MPKSRITSSGESSLGRMTSIGVSWIPAMMWASSAFADNSRKTASSFLSYRDDDKILKKNGVCSMPNDLVAKDVLFSMEECCSSNIDGFLYWRVGVSANSFAKAVTSLIMVMYCSDTCSIIFEGSDDSTLPVMPASAAKATSIGRSSREFSRVVKIWSICSSII